MQDYLCNTCKDSLARLNSGYLPTQSVQKHCMARFAGTELWPHAQPAAARIPEAEPHPENVIIVVEKTSLLGMFWSFEGWGAW